jgi:hypothetical protein
LRKRRPYQKSNAYRTRNLSIPYTILLRRTAVFLKEKFAAENIFFLPGDALRSRSDPTLQQRKGLACINGSGYSEYIPEQIRARTELVMDDSA